VDAEAARVAAARPAMGHVVLVGYGRVGKLIATRLTQRAVPFVVIEGDAEKAEDAQAAGLSVVRGNALEDRHLIKAGVKEAHHLLIAVPEGFEGGAIHEHAIRLNPKLAVIARAHSDAEVEYLEKLGVPHVVMGERELAGRMLSLCGAA
jgi:CPA2 family monovalent cation:H+ antiporter-2